MRPYLLGLALVSVVAAPVSAQEAADDAPAAQMPAGSMNAGVEEAVTLPLRVKPETAGVDLPAACRDGVVNEAPRRTGPSYGPSVPDDVKPAAQTNPCLAPEFRPRAESEVLYEQQRVFEGYSDEKARTGTPNPCVWKQDGTSCTFTVRATGSNRTQNRSDDPFRRD
ncbi:hypothetical protein [Paraurantiacibacter namhicola]|uniref:YARHG domain-containing protein n=1 Tax=Paraurantiacibacter namhicola TaxID=645517 RepID=A0A1C7DA68_9SPHN|nr:hypothetical protein [Paraurantiacibacter namhicola]ANU08338.1 hypothetical protein A6F65_02051 [Paraurantiacibacter namhicola]